MPTTWPMTWLGWLLFFLFGGDVLTLKAIQEGCKHSKVLRIIVTFILSIVGVVVFLAIVVLAIISK
jgi:hypothetical protein